MPGRFVNQDPIGLLGGENLYGFVPNTQNWIDILGLKLKKKKGGGVIGSITCMNKTTGRVTRYSEHSFNAARKIAKREQNVFNFVKNCIRI